MQDPPSIYAQIAPQTQPQFPEQEHLKCPRCDSTNTKFCYYNNYNLSQPRHFCKNCRRYWTKGGALRNIPVGGGSRKNSKRASSSSHSKRSSCSASCSSSSPVSAVAAASPGLSLSSSSSSSTSALTITTTTTVTTTAAAINTTSSLIPPNLTPPDALKAEAFGGQFGNLLEVGGSFSSLLGSSEGQFGNLLDGLGPNGSNLQIGELLDNPGPGNDSEFLNLQTGGGDGGGGGSGGGGGDESGCWNGSNGWPDLAIYTPGSNFQ